MKEGFCWIDVNSTYLKARIKANGVFDVLSMSLFTMTNLPDWYYVALINSEFISLYVDNFINNTSHFQINDARQLPIIIPQKETFESLQKLVTGCISLKKATTTDNFLMGEKQYELDRLVRYSDIEPTSFTDSPFNFTFNNRALGFKRLFQQNPSLK